MQQQLDMFGAALPAGAPARPSQGYASRPGTGPKGQRCNTCRFCHVQNRAGTRVRRCEIRAAEWDKPGMEIKHNAPACRDWQRKVYPKSHEIPY